MGQAGHRLILWPASHRGIGCCSISQNHITPTVVKRGYSSYTSWSYYSYHNLVLERLINVPRYESGYQNLDDIVQVNRLEFCYTHHDLHTAQAICGYHGAGDADYIYGSSWAYKKTAGDGTLNVQLAELVCPPTQTGISNCKINILERSHCNRLSVQCRKHSNCWRPNNFVYSKRYNMYGQICTHGSSCRSCFRCRYTPYGHYHYTWHGHACMSGLSQTYGQEVWEPHFRWIDFLFPASFCHS